MKILENLFFTMIFTKLLTILNFFVVCSGYEMSGHEACVKVRETLGPHALCNYIDEHLIFHQNSNFNGIVQFSKKSERNLKVECFQNANVNLEKLPALRFERINAIEVSQCSLSSVKLLSAIKSSFKIRKVKNLVITATNEQNSTNVLEKLFENLSEVEELEITTGFRVNFEENSFKLLKSLKSLKLNVYDIIALPFNIFVPLETVENLVLTSSSSLKPEEKKFNIKLNKCIRLDTFTLVGVRWPLQVETLVNFFGPRIVSIMNNRFNNISSRAFEKSKHIEELHLKNNSIEKLPTNIFEWQIELNVIDLSFNLLENLNSDIFQTTTYLEDINLSHNRFDYINR
jgi:hypothetical protein